MQHSFNNPDHGQEARFPQRNSPSRPPAQNTFRYRGHLTGQPVMRARPQFYGPPTIQPLLPGYQQSMNYYSTGAVRSFRPPAHSVNMTRTRYPPIINRPPDYYRQNRPSLLRTPTSQMGPNRNPAPRQPSDDRSKVTTAFVSSLGLNMTLNQATTMQSTNHQDTQTSASNQAISSIRSSSSSLTTLPPFSPPEGDHPLLGSGSSPQNCQVGPERLPESTPPPAVSSCPSEVNGRLTLEVQSAPSIPLNLVTDSSKSTNSSKSLKRPSPQKLDHTKDPPDSQKSKEVCVEPAEKKKRPSLDSEKTSKAPSPRDKPSQDTSSRDKPSKSHKKSSSSRESSSSSAKSALSGDNSNETRTKSSLSGDKSNETCTPNKDRSSDTSSSKEKSKKESRSSSRSKSSSSKESSPSERSPKKKRCKVCERRLSNGKCNYCLAKKSNGPPLCKYCGFKILSNMHKISKSCDICKRSYPCVTFMQKHRQGGCQALKNKETTSDPPQLLTPPEPCKDPEKDLPPLPANANKTTEPAPPPIEAETEKRASLPAQDIVPVVQANVEAVEPPKKPSSLPGVLLENVIVSALTEPVPTTSTEKKNTDPTSPQIDETNNRDLQNINGQSQSDSQGKTTVKDPTDGKNPAKYKQCPHCRKKFKEEAAAALEWHLNNKRCDKCEKDYSCYGTLASHNTKGKHTKPLPKTPTKERRSSTEGPVSCNHCKITLKNDISLRSHQFAKKCYKCDKNFPCLTLLDTHVNEGHPQSSTDDSSDDAEEKISAKLKQKPAQKNVEDPDCSASLSASSDDDNEPQKCRICASIFVTKQNLKSHMSNKKCQVCEKIFKCAGEVQKHKKSDHCFCQYCKKIVLDENALELHEGQNICPSCKKAFLCATLLKSHFKDTSCGDALEKEDEIQCNICRKKFSSKEDVVAHQSNATCISCQKSFACHSSLKIHHHKSECKEHISLSVQNETEKVECGECHTSFQSKVSLENHLRRRACRKCSKIISCAESHAVANCTAVTKSPKSDCCICLHCKREYTSLQHLKNHLNKKTCKKCEGSFACSVLLHKHQQTCEHVRSVSHSNEKVSKKKKASYVDLTCPHCFQEFQKLPGLQKHTRYRKCKKCNLEPTCYSFFRDHQCVSSTPLAPPAAEPQPELQMPRTPPELRDPETEMPDPPPQQPPEFSPTISAVHTVCPYCQEQLPEEEIEHHKDALKCPRCSFLQPCLTLLKQHVSACKFNRQEHPGLTHGPQVCLQCEKSFATELQLGMHIQKMHSSPKKKRFQCETCKKKFRSQERLDQHITKRHVPDSVTPDSYSLFKGRGNKIMLARRASAATSSTVPDDSLLVVKQEALEDIDENMVSSVEPEEENMEDVEEREVLRQEKEAKEREVPLSAPTSSSSATLPAELIKKESEKEKEPVVLTLDDSDDDEVMFIEQVQKIQ